MDYTKWWAQAAAELKRLHGIDAESIPDGIWEQLYAQNASPREAADRARAHSRTGRSVFKEAG